MIGYYHYHYMLGNRQLIDMIQSNSRTGIKMGHRQLKKPLQNFWLNMNNFGECVKG